MPGSSSVASLVLALSEVTGFYAVSTLLLIRKNVPEKHRPILDEVLGGTLDFQFFHRWFNGLFLASGLVTAALLYGQYKTEHVDVDLIPKHVAGGANGGTPNGLGILSAAGVVMHRRVPSKPNLSGKNYL